MADRDEDRFKEFTALLGDVRLSMKLLGAVFVLLTRNGRATYRAAATMDRKRPLHHGKPSHALESFSSRAAGLVS